MNYERNRLKEWKKFHKEISHVALCDVGAGYDIKSFDMRGSEIIPRYIEVKATSILDNKFFWSKNEIECARLKKNRYYLYLVPIGENSNVLINKLEIIQDPFKHILRDKDTWEQNVELRSFKKIRGVLNYSHIDKRG